MQNMQPAAVYVYLLVSCLFLNAYKHNMKIWYIETIFQTAQFKSYLFGVSVYKYFKLNEAVERLANKTFSWC